MYIYRGNNLLASLHVVFATRPSLDHYDCLAIQVFAISPVFLPVAPFAFPVPINKVSMSKASKCSCAYVTFYEFIDSQVFIGCDVVTGPGRSRRDPSRACERSISTITNSNANSWFGC